MLKPLSEFQSLPEPEVIRLLERGPLLITQNGEPRLIAQSLDSFEFMVRRLRELEAASLRRPKAKRANLFLLRP